MLSLSWRKWPDAIIDFGRELYIPWRISNGSVLYKDIAYFFGPLSVYVNAFLFKIFGASFMVLAVFNIILIILLTFVIYRIFLKTTNKLTATAAISLFLAVFAFSQYTGIGNFNFVCPYTYSVTHGIFLSFLIIYIFLIYLENRAHKLLYLIGVLLGLVFLTKPEVFFAISIAVFLGICFLISRAKSIIRDSLKIWSMILLGFLIPLVFFIVYLSASMPWSRALGSVILPYMAILKTSVITSVFYSHIMGIDTLGVNAWKLMSVGTWYLLIIIVFRMINNSLFSNISSRRRILVVVVILFSLILIFSLYTVISIAWFQIFRVLPLTTLFLGSYILIVLSKMRDDVKIRKLLPLFIMSVFAFCLLFKIIFSVYIFHYGFALAMPAALLLIAGLFYYLPIFLSRDGRKNYFFQTLSLILLGIVLITHMNVSRRIYGLKSYALGSGGDALFTFGYQSITVGGNSVKHAIDKIKGIVKEKENFVVFPEGVMLNYLTRRINPTPHLNFCPPELEIFGEDEILRSFMENKPDYFILMHRNMSEYGCPASGKYCGKKILSWIEENYTPVFTSAIGSLTSRGSGFTISKRK